MMKPINIYNVINNIYEAFQFFLGLFIFFIGLTYLISHWFDLLSFWLVTIGLTFMSWTLLSELIGRKFDKLFKQNLKDNPLFQIDMAMALQLPTNIVGQLRLVRTIAYTREILFQSNLRKKKAWNKDHDWFGSFNFRKNVNYFEIFLAYLAFVSGVTMIVSAICFFFKVVHPL